MHDHTYLWVLGGCLGVTILAALMKAMRSSGEGFIPPKGVPPTLEDVKRLAEAGRKIEAIKLYRGLRSVSLVQAKAAVEQLIAGATLAPTERSDSAPADGMEAVRQLAATGQKIQAIKLYREITGAGLKEAKDAVESGTLDRAVPPGSMELPDMAAVRQAIADGNLILAIKLYREMNPGKGLAESKEAVERMK